jgi:hypothetical protein
MNQRKAKRIRRAARKLSIEWLKSLVSEEEGRIINEKNFMKYMPKQTHLMSQEQMIIMPNSYRYFVKAVKRGIKHW